MTTRRRFTLLDALVMIAALGVSMAVFRIKEKVPDFYLDMSDPWPNPTAILIARIVREIQGNLGTVQLCLIPPTIAVLALRLRSPRPRFRRLARQPGWVACVMASLSSLVAGLLLLSCMAMNGADWGRFLIRSLWAYNGPTVAGAWILLAMSGRWKSEASWIDRMGRLLGLGWVLSLVLAELAGPWLYSPPPPPLLPAPVAPPAPIVPTPPIAPRPTEDEPGFTPTITPGADMPAPVMPAPIVPTPPIESTPTELEPAPAPGPSAR